MYAPGGFIPLSPASSSVASTSTPGALPHPRSSPLRSGGAKESTFIRHVDKKILRIQRRFAKRDTSTVRHVVQEDEQGRSMVTDFAPPLDHAERWHDVTGYSSFAAASRDVEELLGIIWLSGTPSLQIPYLTSLALLINTMIPAFPASPRQLFRVIRKLDHAFASLIVARDIETDQLLPGFERGRGVSTTEKVRIKGLIERTRIATARVMAEGDFAEEDEVDEQDGDLIMDQTEDHQTVDDWNMELAKVYDHTLQELGDTMDGPAIGIRTESRP